MSIGLNKTLDGKWEVARESLRADLLTIETFLNRIRLVGGAVTSVTNLAGILAVIHGGTGAATLTGVLLGHGTSPVTAVALPADATKFLNGTGAFSTVTSGLTAPQVAARVAVRL